MDQRSIVLRCLQELLGGWVEGGMEGGMDKSSIIVEKQLNPQSF